MHMECLQCCVPAADAFDQSLIIEDASARPPHPEMASRANSLPCVFFSDLCLIFGKVLQHLGITEKNFAIDFRSFCARFSVDFRLFWVVFCVRRAFGVHFERDLRKVALRGPTVSMKKTHFWRFGDPRGHPKSRKIVKDGDQKSMFFRTCSRNPLFTVSEAKMEPKQVGNRWQFEFGVLRQRRSKKRQLSKAARCKKRSKYKFAEKKREKSENLKTLRIYLFL